jgi:hypothetical protein
MNKKLKKAIVLGTTLVFLGSSLSSCSYVSRGIDLRTNITMTKTISLDPELKKYNKQIYIEVINTSDFYELSNEELKNLIAEKLSSKGYQIVDDIDKAGYVIKVDLKNMNHLVETGEKEGKHEGFWTGAVSGATIGAATGHDTVSTIAGTAIGGMVGTVGGTAIGKAFKTESYKGEFDIELRERLNKIIAGKITTKAEMDTETELQTENIIQINWQIYKTKIVVSMNKTNLKRTEAAKVIAEKVAKSIAELF